MFLAKLPRAAIVFPNSTAISLSKNLPASIPRIARTTDAKNTGRYLRGEVEGADALALQNWKQSCATVRDAETVIQQTAAHVEVLKATHRALDTGEFTVTDNHPMVRAALEVHGLKAVIARKSPDAIVVTEDMTTTLDNLAEAIDALENALTTARERFDALAAVVGKSAKAVFCFYGDLGEAIRKGVHLDLPKVWQNEIDLTLKYGLATQDPFGSDADINASILQRRFLGKLDQEYRRMKSLRSEAKRSLDEQDTLNKLREAHGNE